MVSEIIELSAGNCAILHLNRFVSVEITGSDFDLKYRDSELTTQGLKDVEALAR